MRTREELVRHLETGAVCEYLCFWGHTPNAAGTVDASCLSQWFPQVFVVDGTHFASAEHFMMVSKARLFADVSAERRILAAPTPAEAKAIGREVRGFDALAWEAARFDAVVAGNVAKFGQHQELRHFLRSTGEKVLVEASPRDRIWGIGLGASNPDAREPTRWRGRNLLGFALMEARSRLA